MKNRFIHPGNIGDCWAAIPAMREYYRQTGNKIKLYLVANQDAHYYDGATHPTKDEKGINVMLNNKMIEMMIPLLQAQEFIDEAKIWENEPFDYDFGMIRETEVGMPGMSINRWYFYIYADLNCDLSKVWLDVPRGTSAPDEIKGKIIVTRSERYLNPNANYSFLKEYEDDIVFVGTMREYNVFCMGFDLNIKKYHVNNFLELTVAIRDCKFHITNQTQAFQLSEGLKVPRILEIFRHAPNCIPIGEKAYDFFSQIGLEAGFHKLNGTYDGWIEKLKKEQQMRLLSK